VKLTERQKAFCDYYIETLNATESYKKAGYKVKTNGAARVNNKTPSTRDRVKAAELLGKRYALFTEKVNVEGNMGVTIIDDVKEDDNNDEG